MKNVWNKICAFFDPTYNWEVTAEEQLKTAATLYEYHEDDRVTEITEQFLCARHQGFGTDFTIIDQ